MADKTVKARQQQKYDTATNWKTNNPILLKGEIGVESDTNKMKIGDGVSNWIDLSYVSGGGTKITIGGQFQPTFDLENLIRGTTIVVLGENDE